MKPVKGFRFLHARFLDASTMGPNPQPQLFEVTRVAQGCVWYRPIYKRADGREDRGKGTYCTADQFPKYMKAVA